MKAGLSVAFEDLRGKAGSVVIQKSRSGLVVKPHKVPKNPRSQAQQSIRANLIKAATAYKNLTQAQVQAWQDYALTITKINPVSGEPYHPSANNVFVGLAAKVLQVNGAASIPTSPPAGSFSGDTITITATAIPGSKVQFTASGANAAGVTTELLLQKLPSLNRVPFAKNYRTKAFNNWGGSLMQQINSGPGIYAAAYRFVKTATGQTTPLQILPIMSVQLSLSESDKSKSQPKLKKAA